MKKLKDLCLSIKQSIDQAGRAAAESKDSLAFAAHFRCLLEITKEKYPILIYAAHNIDITAGLPLDDYNAEAISAQCNAMLEFCESPRFVALVKRFDPALGRGDFPFFSYLEKTIERDARKLQAEDYMQSKYEGMTGLYEYRNKEREEKVYSHIARVLNVKAAVGPSDYEKIAAAVGCDVSLVVDVLRREWASGTMVRLDQYVDEEGDDETQMYELIAAPPTSPAPEEGEARLMNAYLLLAPTLTAMEQDAARYGFTKALIHDRLMRLVEQLHQEDNAINSIPTLFTRDASYALQQLLVLKAEFEGHPMIEPRLISLAAKEKQSPSFARVAKELGRSEEAFRKTYNNVKKKLERQLS